jgi:large subunit ribosomal protein L17e
LVEPIRRRLSFLDSFCTAFIGFTFSRICSPLNFATSLLCNHCLDEQLSVKMVRYSVEPEVPEKRPNREDPTFVSTSNIAGEIAHTTHGMNVEKALKFCDDVLSFKAAVPFVRFTGGIGHHAQAKQHKAPGNSGRWPVKAMQVYKDLLSNAVANAETKGLDSSALVITHAQCNRAPPGRRRTYRAHGRVGKYASQPAHIEIILTEKAEAVEKEAEALVSRLARKWPPASALSRLVNQLYYSS